MGYRITRDGSLEGRFGGHTTTIGPDDTFAIAYEIDDQVGGTVHAHGSVEWARRKRDEVGVILAFLGKDEDDSRLVELPVAALDDQVVEEINACLDTSGRIGRFAERLEGLAALAATGGPRH